MILVVSKWDLVQKDEAKKEYETKLRQEVPHLEYAPVVFTSAHSGYGIDRLMPTIRRVHDEYTKRISTGQLNRFVEELMEISPPPSRKGKPGKIYYLSQVGVRPPQFQVSVNDPERIHFSYRRFLVNKIREEYGFSGVPLLVGYRAHHKKNEDAAHVEPGRKQAAASPAKKATAARRAKKAGKKPGKPSNPTRPSKPSKTEARDRGGRGRSSAASAQRSTISTASPTAIVASMFPKRYATAAAAAAAIARASIGSSCFGSSAGTTSAVSTAIGTNLRMVVKRS